MDFVSTARFPAIKLRLGRTPAPAALPKLPFLVAGIVILGMYLPSLRNDFVAWDDDRNFLTNQDFRGISGANLGWMFTTSLGGPYQPLSWVTLGVDYLLWGMNPFGYHLTNILLHALAAALVAAVAAELYRLRAGKTDWVGVDQVMVGPSVSTFQSVVFGLAAAGLWALHPLRAEAVSWVTERREVLCGVLTLLTLFAYLRGTNRLAVAVLGGAAMLSKATAVVTPVLLVLIDLYKSGGIATPQRLSRLSKACLRHSALLVICIAVGIGALIGQANEGASVAANRLEASDRAILLLNAIGFYAVKTVWPSGLAPLYELPTRLDGAFERFDTSTLRIGAALGLSLLVAALAAGWMLRRRVPSILPLTFAYVCMVAPTSGLVQAGRQFAADRYSYQPGWILALAAAGMMIAAITKLQVTAARRGVAIAAICALALTLVPRTFAQQAIWRNTESLWNQELAVYPHNPTAHYGLGYLYWTRDAGPASLQPAESHFRAAVAAMPVYDDAHAGLGHVLLRTDRMGEAIAAYRESLRIAPANNSARNGLAHAYWRQGRRSEAIEQLRELVKVDPNTAASHWLLGSALAADDSPEEAAREFEQAVHCQPDCVPVLTDFAWFLSTYPNHRIRNGKRSVELAETAARLAGGQNERLVKVLAAAYAESGDFSRATQVVQTAASSLPDERAGTFKGLLVSLRGHEPIRESPTFR